MGKNTDGETYSSQDKKIILVLSLFIGLGIIAIYRFIYISSELIYIQELINPNNIFFISSLLISGLALLVGSYGLLKNKWDTRYIGLAGALLLLFVMIANVHNIAIRTENSRPLFHQLYNLFFVFVSAITFIVAILYWKYLEKRIDEKPFFPDKITAFLYYSCVSVGFISLHIFSNYLTQHIRNGTFSRIYDQLHLFLYLVIFLIFIIASIGLIKNKWEPKLLVITGILLFSFFLILTIIYYDNNDVLILTINKFILLGFLGILFVITSYNWKKL